MKAVAWQFVEVAPMLVAWQNSVVEPLLSRALAGERRHGGVLQLLDALLGQEEGDGLAAPGGHAGGRELESARHRHEPDHDDERRDEHLGQREAALTGPHCTVTRPVVNTCTLRVLPSLGLVTV